MIRAFNPGIDLNNYILTSALRLLALRGLRTLCVRRRRRVTLINYKGDNIPKYVRLYYCYNRYRTKNHQICQFLKFLMSNDDVITK